MFSEQVASIPLCSNSYVIKTPKARIIIQRNETVSIYRNDFIEVVSLFILYGIAYLILSTKVGKVNKFYEITVFLIMLVNKCITLHKWCFVAKTLLMTHRSPDLLLYVFIVLASVESPCNLTVVSE